MKRTKKKAVPKKRGRALLPSVVQNLMVFPPATPPAMGPNVNNQEPSEYSAMYWENVQVLNAGPSHVVFAVKDPDGDQEVMVAGMPFILTKNFPRGN